MVQTSTVDINLLQGQQKSSRERASANARTLEGELDWLSLVLHSRVRQYFQPGEASLQDFRPPELQPNESEYAEMLHRLKATHEERLIILLALTPQLRPQLLDVFFTQNSSHPRSFSDFGGFNHSSHGGFSPTIETAIFLIAGADLARRFEVMGCFREDHFFFREQILPIDCAVRGEAQPRTPISVTDEFWQMITTGMPSQPMYSERFPAQRIYTEQDWEDLVVDTSTLEEINEIRAWIEHGKTVMENWGLSKVIPPGYRSLFYGPPGTGKTFVACLLGKSTGRDVYWVDLSQVVGKHIGETEKTLSNVFRQAANKDWILYLDGADSLFDNLNHPSDIQNKYSSQELKYLLQRIEEYPGIIIFATNIQSQLDESFARRFVSVIHFALPSVEERIDLWRSFFSGKLQPGPDVDLARIAQEYELKAGAMINVVRYCALAAIRRGDHIATTADIVSGIRRELGKEGRAI